MRCSKRGQPGGTSGFRLYEAKDLEHLRATRADGGLVLDFDMSKLEKDLDNDTDEEEVKAAKRMLRRENRDAINYFVEEDPQALVENLSRPTQQGS